MGYRSLATAILVVHFAFLAYVVLGGYLAWRWPRTFWVHLAAAGWGLAVIAVPLECPLTAAENWARHHAGEAVSRTGFIDQYIEGVLYPPKYTGLMQAAVALTIFISWVGLAILWRRRRRAATTAGKSEDSSRHAATV